MSILEWKKMNFFRLIPEADHKKIRQCVKSKITACISNSIYKILCDDLGGVHIFFRNWESISFFTNSSPVKFGALAMQCNSLVTLSNSETSEKEIVLKVWDLNKITKRNGAPCIGTAVINATSPASAMSAYYNSSCFYISVGFERGELSLFRGTVGRDFSAGFKTFQISTRRITGIEFKTTNSKHLTMFVCTYAGIFCFNITENNDIREASIVLDTRNEPARCCAQQIGYTDEQYFIVGRDDAVYCYTSEGRGPCYAIDGQKLYLAKSGNYLIIVVYLANALQQAKKYQLITIDVNLKIIVLNKPLESIAGVLFENKNCFILTEANQLFAVYEKDLNTKLELLLKKHLYDISLRLMEQENCDEKLRARIFRLYGDHLYLKGDFSGAVEKYKNTIGVVEPYCVIQKFIDSKSVVYLLEYMEALLKTEFATEEHIQLYLNCNSRVRLPVKLREYLSHIEQENSSYNDIYCSLSESKSSLKQINNVLLNQKNTDIETEIHGGSITKFLSLIDNISEAENFLCRFEEQKIYSFFKEHSQTLMQFHPKQTTEILKIICGKNFMSRDNKTLVRSPELFLPLFIGHAMYCKDFLMHLIQVIPNCQPIVYNYLFELQLRDWKEKKCDTEHLVQFLERFHGKYDENHILILCKLHSFLDGILHFFKNNDLNNLSIQYFLKTGDFKNIYSCLKSANMKINIPCLRDIDLSSEGASSLISYVLNDNLNNKTDSQLQIFQNISEIEKVKVGHVKEFYAQQFLLLETDFEKNSKTVEKLNNDFKNLEKILECFQLKAIEIRNQFCDICELQIKQPAIYFLCQHSFHKHCLNLYSEDKLICFVCNTKSKEESNEVVGNDQSLVNLTRSNDYIAFIENSIRKGILNTSHTFKTPEEKLIENNPFETIPDNLRLSASTFYKKNKAISSNPFETDDDDEVTSSNQYDANLNPFEE